MKKIPDAVIVAAGLECPDHEGKDGCPGCVLYPDYFPCYNAPKKIALRILRAYRAKRGRGRG